MLSLMRKAFGLVLVLLAALPVSTGEASAAFAEHVGQPRALTFEERGAAQRAIEEVYWRHRIWPKENPTPKPSLDAVMPESAIRAKVEDYLRESNALEEWWQRPITGEQLQAELDRMARDTRDPQVLQELFDVLGGDAFLIAETLARQTLAERLVRSWYASDDRCHDAPCTEGFDAWWKDEREAMSPDLEASKWPFTLPSLDPGACTNDTWSPTPNEDRKSVV